MRKKIVLCLVASLALPVALRAGTVTPLRDGWSVQSACNLKGGGDLISTEGFSAYGWLKASVPSTVLAAQVAAGTFPDPYFGMNINQLPGTEDPAEEAGTTAGYSNNFVNFPMPQNSPYRCGWWYRIVFTAPAASQNEERYWLHFGGINYRADLWLNGRRIADSTAIAGSWRTYDFDVTEHLKPGQENVLAVETFAPTENDLGFNWNDWSPTPPDKDMGLWGRVDLVETGAVTVSSPMAVTHFHGSTLSVADLTVYAELHNSTGHTVKGVATGSAAGVRFEQPVELAAHEDRTVVFTPEQYPALGIHDPKPWWPRQMGQPHLERLTVGFTAQGRLTDEQSVDFGFREITSELTAASGSRLYRVNGKPILIRGGSWSRDMLLREDEHRLRDQFRLVSDLNLNTIRLEGQLEPEEFFHLADEQGILVLMGFPCCDHWEHWRKDHVDVPEGNAWTAEDLAIATASLRSQMLRLRHHACMLVWLNGDDWNPPADVERAYLKVESETHWPNPVLASAGARFGLTGPTGVKENGPYDYVEPSYWYVDRQYGGAFGFNTETGPGPDIPSLASREKFLPDPQAWPPTSTWNLHAGRGHFRNFNVLDQAMEGIYGKPHSAAEYERLAETMEYDTERAMFEAFNKNKYVATGVILHMLNNSWPSMIWHLYDYYLDADGGYFGAKKACEPLHIQYSYDDHSIVVVNSTYAPVSGLHAAVRVHNLAWKELFSSEAAVDAEVDSAQRAFLIPENLYSGSDKILLIDLILSDASGRVLSRNFYWVPTTLTTFDWGKTDYTRSPAARYEDLSALMSLPPANLLSRAEIGNTSSGREIRVHLDNQSTALAFQIRAAVRTPSGGLIAPVLWSDNWIELAPGESRTLTALLPENAFVAPIVQLEGWNIAPETITPVAAVVAH
ncbi:MAG: glycosyl hydrolase family 2 [Terracidiphilus sp.]